MSRNFLSKHDELRKGDFLMSNNGAFKAVFQEDGNFVIYGWSPVWASGTYGSDAVRVCMQSDCNLVMYNACGQPKWASNTFTNETRMCRLQLTNGGDLVLFKESEEIWRSKKDK